MNIDDQASVLEEQTRELALKLHAEKLAHFRSMATGRCLSCGDDELPSADSLHCGDSMCVADVDTILKQRERGLYRG